MIAAPRSAEQSTLDVLFCCDRAYVKGLAVAVESLLSNASVPCRIHVASTGIDRSLLQRLVSDWQRHRTLEQVCLHSLTLVSPEYHGNCHFSRASFGKISLTALLGNNLAGRLLVLDPDVVVQRDVADCLKVVLDGKLLAIFGSAEQRWINAGVMLVNCSSWRQRRTDEALLALWREDSHVRNAEQDLLNRLLFAKPEIVTWLDGSWNICAKNYEIGEPGIVHYIGGRKPWHGDYRIAAPQQFFYRYLDRTIFQGQRESQLGSLAMRYLNKWRIGFLERATRGGGFRPATSTSAQAPPGRIWGR
jgi:lipopolysaccharide biosynthesis glycosyltransferase